MKKVTAFVWMFSFAWGFIGIFNWSLESVESIFSIKVVDLQSQCVNKNYNYYATSFVIYLLALVIMSCTYCSILSVALSQIKAIEATQVTVTMLNTTEYNSKYGAKQKKKRTIHRELKATKSIAIVYLTFVACWLPSAFINIIILFDENYFFQMQINNRKLFLFLYYFFVELLPIFNTMVNPVIYSFSNREFQHAFKRVQYKLVGHSLRSAMDPHEDNISDHHLSLTSPPSSRISGFRKKDSAPTYHLD